MKKLKIIAIVLILSLTFTSLAVANANIELFNLTTSKYPILVEGEEYSNSDLPVLNYEGHTYVPLKSISSLLGTPVIWNDLLRRVEISKETRKLTFTAEQTSELDRLLHDGSLKVTQDVQVSLNGKPLDLKSELGEFEVDSIALTLNSNNEAVQVDLDTDTDTDAVTTKIDKPKKKLKVKLTCCPIGIEITWESGEGISDPGTGGGIGDLDAHKELANQELSFDLNKDAESIRKVLNGENLLMTAQDAVIEYNGEKIDYFAGAGVESIYHIDIEQANIQFNEKGEASTIQILNNTDGDENPNALKKPKPKPKVVLKVTCCPLNITVGVSF